MLLQFAFLLRLQSDSFHRILLENRWISVVFPRKNCPPIVHLQRLLLISEVSRRALHYFVKEGGGFSLLSSIHISKIIYKFDSESIRWRLNTASSENKKYTFTGDMWNEII